jgi:small conductance mechanosensitive channel
LLFLPFYGQSVAPSLAQARREVGEAVDAISAMPPTEIALRGGLSALVILAALIVLVLVRRARTAVSKKFQENGRTFSSKQIGGITQAWVTLAVLIAVVFFCLRIWGLDAAHFARTATGGALTGIVRVAFILILAIAAMEMINVGSSLAVDRIVKADRGRRHVAKLRTLTAMMKGLGNALVLLIATAMVMATAGIEIAPLLAGAGVAGIAIGFGAQSLVKDLFTGAFLIVEDIVAYGDIVEIAGVTGSVEAMTLRTIRIRDFDGTLHVFPYGEAQVIHNKTSSFSRFAFRLQISYLSDIKRAISVVETVIAELQTMPDIGKLMIGDQDPVGIEDLADNGVVLRGRIRTEPGGQVVVGRAFYLRVKEALDDAGVLIAQRHLPVPPFDTIEDRVATGQKPINETPGE